MRRHLFLACLLTTLAAPALFEGTAHADDAAVAEAQSRFREGLDLADAGKHEAARLKFQQALAVFKAPAVLYNLARSEQLTGHDLEALEHFRQFIKASATDPKITDAMREKAKQNVADLAKKVGQLDIEVPSTARVSIDGKALDEVPQEPVPVAPGSHKVEATLEGRVKSVAVDAAAGAVTKVKIELDGSGPTEPPGGGVEPSRSGWSTGRVVTVSALSAGAIVGGILFFVFRGAAQSNVDEAQSLLNGGSCIGVTNDPCTRAASLKDDRDSSVTLSTVSIIAGATFAAGAVAAALLWPKGGAETARIAPVVAPGYGGAGLVGRF